MFVFGVICLVYIEVFAVAELCSDSLSNQEQMIVGISQFSCCWIACDQAWKANHLFIILIESWQLFVSCSSCLVLVTNHQYPTNVSRNLLTGYWQIVRHQPTVLQLVIGSPTRRFYQAQKERDLSETYAFEFASTWSCCGTQLGRGPPSRWEQRHKLSWLGNKPSTIHPDTIGLTQRWTN